MTSCLSRFIASFHEKLVGLRNELDTGSVSPANIIQYLVTCQSETLPETDLTTQVAVSVVSEVIYEVDTLRRSAATLCRMIESLSRIGQRSSGVHGPASKFLSVLPPAVLTLFFKGTILFNLRAITYLLNRTYGRKEDSVGQNTVGKEELEIIAASFVIVRNGLEFVRNWTLTERNDQGIWTPKNVAGAAEDSPLALPGDVPERVFAHVSDVVESLREYW